MTPRINYSTIGIYESRDFQNHRLSYAYGRVFPMSFPLGYILPFQFAKTKTGTAITSFKLVSKDESTTIDILSGMTASGLTTDTSHTDYDLVIYNGLSSIGVTATMGQWFFEFSDGTNTYTSDVFIWGNTIDEMLMIECWHGEDFLYPKGKIKYQAPYKTKFYLCAQLGKPDYEYEEKVEKRDGYEFPIQQTTYKLHKFTVLMSEYLIDFVRLVQLHDVVEITARGQKHSVDKFLMNKPEWQTDGDLASVTFEFKTDTVVTMNGRGLADLDYQLEVSECPIAVMGRYNSEAQADNSGVNVDEYFADTMFAGAVIKLYSNVKYKNDAEAALNISFDSCYAVSIENPYGLPKNAIRRLNPVKTYNKDSDAAADGVPIDGIYYAGENHIDGVPFKTAKIRLS